MGHLPEIALQRIDPAHRRHRATMLWTRGHFLKTTYDWGKVVVHGHTPVPRVTQWPNRINIDTGCVFRGRLTAIALPGEACFSVLRMQTPQRVVLRDVTGNREAHRFSGTIQVRVQSRDRIHELVTVDYSELGMYVRALDPSQARFAEGDPIEGVIAPDSISPVGFTGVIVRQHVDDLGVHYGVKLLDSTPLTPTTDR